jgi:hypothetical protein
VELAGSCVAVRAHCGVVIHLHVHTSRRLTLERAAPGTSAAPGISHALSWTSWLCPGRTKASSASTSSGSSVREEPGSPAPAFSRVVSVMPLRLTRSNLTCTPSSSLADSPLHLEGVLAV